MYLCKTAKCEVSHLTTNIGSNIDEQRHLMNNQRLKTKKMNYKKIIICIALGLAGFTSNLSATEPAAAIRTHKAVDASAPNVYWTDANGQVSYNINAKTAPVVKIALNLFENDMKAVTGNAARQKAAAPIQIFQLDQLTNKEFSGLEKLGAPVQKIITTKDAYFIGVRKKKLIVVGSNARGTAYAILELSKMAGVSPWSDWYDLKPQPRKSIFTPVDQQWIGIPRIEFRGLALNGSKWMNPQNYSRIARLMLRLKYNTLWQVDGKHDVIYNKAVVDSFDICIAENYRVTEWTGKKHKKKHRKTLENVKMVCDNAEMPIENVAPGLVLDMLNNKDYLETKSERREKSHRHEAHNDEDCAWIANVTNPKKAPLQLAMMSDLAWNPYALKAGIRNYLQSWLNNLFGSVAGKKIQPLMEEYYSLTSIRQPAYMAMPYGDTEFHSGEFGNELERFLYNYDLLKTKTVNIEKTLPAGQRDGFFEIVKYPIFSAALIAEKELEAQEARHIARPGLFYKDDEAKAAAAVSLNAYNTLKQLNAYYARIGKGKWANFIDSKASEMQAPQLPGTLRANEIKSLMADAFNRNTDFLALSNYTNDIIAKNAYEWQKGYNAPQSQGKDAERIRLIPLLGHSNKAVKLPKGATLNYTFYSRNGGDARFTLAVIPCYLDNQKNMRVSVSIDRAKPVVCQMKEIFNSKEWKFDHWRGQSLKNFYVTLSSGNHSIEIKALDDNVIIDQWVVDFDVDREYYVFPVSR